MDLKIERSFPSIDIHKLSDRFDRLNKLNGTAMYVFFIFNVYVMVHYAFVYNGLDEGAITDGSIIIIPILGLITSFLLCAFHNYSKNIQTVSDILGMIFAVVCVTLLYTLIPIIGFKFDVLGISADYWDFTSHIISDLLIYLIVFGLINFVIKAKLEDDKNHG